MNLAVSTILVFFLFIIPGLIFRRFYFSKEFSRQYFKSVPFQVIFTSIIPGIFGQSLFSLIINNERMPFEKVNYDKVFTLLLGSESSVKMVSVTNIITENINEILLYNFTLWLLMAFSGVLIKSLVRKIKLDRKSSIFRFQNEWHYIFRAEIYDYPVLNKKNKSKYSGVKLFWTEVDVLVENGGFHYLYHGVLDEYVLDNSNHGIDRIYLSKALRWTIDNDGNKITSSEHKISGDFMLIPYCNITNMNITYIHTKPAKNQVNIEVKQNITTIFQIIFILFIWTYDFFISIPMVDTHNHPVWLKIASTFLSLFIFEIFIDSARIKEFKNEKEKNAELISKKRKEIVSSIIIVIISSLTISILLFSK